MASGAQPEAGTFTLPAGVYYVDVEYYDAGSGTAPFYYKLKVTT